MDKSDHNTPQTFYGGVKITKHIPLLIGVILKSNSIGLRDRKFPTVPLYLPLNASGILKGVTLHSLMYNAVAFATHVLLNSGRSFVLAEKKSSTKQEAFRERRHLHVCDL